MRAPVVLLLSLGLALAACGKSADTPKTADEVKAEVAKLDRPEPGQYRTTLKISDISVPGMPADRMEKMKSMFGATGRTLEFCLSKEDADKGFEELTKRGADGNCTYDKFSAASGTIDARLSCQTARGVTMVYAMNGTYSATGSHMSMTSDAKAGSLPGGGMHMAVEVTNERIGECR